MKRWPCTAQQKQMDEKSRGPFDGCGSCISSSVEKTENYISLTPSTKALSLRLRLGWRSLRRALASIWRMRSRVTWKLWPTSSRVCSEPSSRPKRILMTRSSRGVRVRRTCEVYSLRLTLMTASEGETAWRSSMKSPRCESSSSPMGVSSEMGSCAILRTLRTLATGMSMRRAISSL